MPNDLSLLFRPVLTRISKGCYKIGISAQLLGSQHFKPMTLGIGNKELNFACYLESVKFGIIEIQ